MCYPMVTGGRPDEPSLPAPRFLAAVLDVVALAMALFFMAFVFDFNSTMATLIIVSFVIGCALLAPSIILGYAVKAAERDDVEHGR